MDEEVPEEPNDLAGQEPHEGEAADVTQNQEHEKYAELAEAVGFLQGHGEQKVILAETSNPSELICGRFDLSKQEAFYSFNGKEEVATMFKIVEGLLLPKGQQAPDDDAIGYQTECPTHKSQGKHWCGLADTPNGLIPGKIFNGSCWYSLDGNEVETKDFHYVVVKSVNGEPRGSASHLLSMSMPQNAQNTIQYSGSSRQNLIGQSSGLYNIGANPNEMIDQLPSDYIYTEMFKAFDVEQ